MPTAHAMSPSLLRDIADHIETPRLLIRCPRPGDGQAVFEGVRDSLAALRAWPASLPWALFEPSIEASETFCREGHLNYLARKELPMLMFLKDGGHYIGGAGFHHLDWDTPKCEAGYWCRPAFQGQGLVTEAVSALCRWAMQDLGMARITALPDAENQPSRAVAERAGMVLEATLRHERKAPDGTLRNTCLYALTAHS